MEPSILKSTKKILNVPPDYTAFDIDIITHINSAFSVLNQLGVGPTTGFMIESDEEVWDDFEVPTNQINLIRTYIYLKTKILFDPPGTSFLLDAVKEQIIEQEWRLSAFRDEVIAEESV